MNTELEEIIQGFQEKGLEKQAVLLESRFSHPYLLTLVQKKHRESVSERLGKDLYEKVKNFAVQIHDYKHLMRLTSPFMPRTVSMHLLHIRRDSLFSEETLSEMITNYTALQEFKGSVGEQVYRAVEQFVEKDEEQLVRIYAAEDYPKTEEEYLHVLKNKSSLFSKLYKLFSPPVILYSQLGSLEKLFVEKGHAFQEWSTNEQEIQQSFLEHQGNSERIQLLWEKHESYLHEIIDETREKTSSLRKMKKLYQLYTNPNYRKRRIILFGKKKIQMGKMNDHENFPLFTESAREILETDIESRRCLLDMYNDEIVSLRSTCVGLQQIIEGGRVVNLEEDSYSTAQNHARFPNIPYPPAIKQTLQGTFEKIQQSLEKLTDMNDIVLPARKRKLQEFDFLLEELAKDPLDITFGNDGACCIAVSKEVENLGNGFSVPLYLLDKHIRLFGIYRQDSLSKKERIGIIPAFETTFQKEYKGLKKRLQIFPKSHIKEKELADAFNYPTSNNIILSCNSVEISPLGVPGGTETMSSLVKYVEDCLIKYTQEHGYAGISMGAHGYNTSFNYSIHTKERTEQALYFIGSVNFFHSDIFKHRRRKDGRYNIVAPLGSSYWLWRDT